MTTELDRLSQELAQLQASVARLQLARDRDMEDIRTAIMMAEFVLYARQSIDDQEVAGYRPAASHKELGPVEVVVPGVVQGEQPLHGDALD